LFPKQIACMTAEYLLRVAHTSKNVTLHTVGVTALFRLVEEDRVFLSFQTITQELNLCLKALLILNVSNNL
jgi:hypothetical protein